MSRNGIHHPGSTAKPTSHEPVDGRAARTGGRTDRCAVRLARGRSTRNVPSDAPTPRGIEPPSRLTAAAGLAPDTASHRRQGGESPRGTRASLPAPGGAGRYVDPSAGRAPSRVRRAVTKSVVVLSSDVRPLGPVRAASATRRSTPTSSLADTYVCPRGHARQCSSHLRQRTGRRLPHSQLTTSGPWRMSTGSAASRGSAGAVASVEAAHGPGRPPVRSRWDARHECPLAPGCRF
jgi:hypothetical protein